MLLFFMFIMLHSYVFTDMQWLLKNVLGVQESDVKDLAVIQTSAIIVNNTGIQTKLVMLLVLREHHQTWGLHLLVTAMTMILKVRSTSCTQNYNKLSLIRNSRENQFLANIKKTFWNFYCPLHFLVNSELMSRSYKKLVKYLFAQTFCSHI